ncbi:hypothetical protein MLD38_010226 [Melastoma candidum]|uniref:Uncharacterized protein n=1 Tax=Melastoma candidum TaxID=119954 RepID=A0ACB9R7H4_9MYRT|nr:hypothetical protein MLD38_010226 [Melastoma candidum]
MDGGQHHPTPAAAGNLYDPTSCWDFLDPSFFEDASSNPCYLSAPNPCIGSGVDFVAPQVGDDCSEKLGPGKRSRDGENCRRGTKACRERLRRERLNDKFQDLSALLEPGRSVKTDKPAILDDAIRVLTQLRAESQELRETNEKLLEEIQCLKAEKNELKDEKIMLKADKMRLEQQVKTMAVPRAGFIPTHPAATYHAVANKVPVFPSYGYYPMWQFLQPSACDTSSDHELRPPAA